MLGLRLGLSAASFKDVDDFLTGAGGYVPVPWVPDCRRFLVYNGIPYQVKQRAGDRFITAENMHTDFSTKIQLNESARVACSNVRL